MRRRRAVDARRPGGIHALPAQSARRAGPAPGRDGVHGRVGRRCAVRDRAAGRAVRVALARRVRRRARHAGRTVPVGRVRGAAAAPHLGSREALGRGPRERASGWPWSTAAPSPTAGSTACSWPAPKAARPGSASSTRRWSSRAAWARRSCSARRHGASRRSPTIASRCRPRLASPGRCPSGRARRRPADRVRAHHRRIGPHAVGHARGGRDRSPHAPARPRSARGREPPRLPRRPACRHRRPARRPHHRHRALPRRTGRLARVPVVAAGGSRADAVGHGRGRAHPGPHRSRRRDHVDRRWVRRPVPGDGRTARLRCSCPSRTRSRRSCSPVGRHRAVRGEVPRVRRARAVAAAAAAGPAHAALAAAQARRRPAAASPPGPVPDAARGVPRVPARPLRHAGAGGPVARRRARRIRS